MVYSFPYEHWNQLDKFLVSKQKRTKLKQQQQQQECKSFILIRSLSLDEFKLAN